MLEDILLIQLMFDSIGGIPTKDEREAWLRIKKAALESCQQSGEAPAQQAIKAKPADITPICDNSLCHNWSHRGCKRKNGCEWAPA